MSKAITPVISVILLLLVTISIVGFAMIFFTRSVTETSAEAEQQLTKQTQAFGENFEVISIDGNKVYVRNKGTAELKNLAFFVDNNPVPATGAPVAKDSVGTFTLNATQLAQYPGKKLKVTSAGFSQQEDANFYAKNTVAYWTFDGTDGRTIKDESGNNNHGTFVGETFNDGDLKPSCPNCPVQTTGKYGNALRFDGTDDYVDMGNKAILNINGPITVGLWVYWTGSGDQVLYSNVNGAVVMGIHIRTSGTNTLEVYYNYNGNYWYRYTSSFSPNMWHYIAFTFDAATSTLTLYIDGVGTSSGSSTPYPRGVANTNIGRRPDIGVAYFNGTIDEVRVYNRALSAAEVAEDMNSPYPIDRPVASYSFEKIVNNKAWDTHNVVRGKYGSAISFDGVNDFVNISDSPIFTFGTGTADTPFSIEAWIIYPIVSASNIVTKGESGNGEWVFGINGNGQLAARVVDLSAGADATRTSVPAVPLNEWVHVAFTYTGLNKMTGAAFFINGVEVSATVNNNPSYVAMENTNYAVTIGTGTTSSGGTIRSFNGTIDEVRILNVARS